MEILSTAFINLKPSEQASNQYKGHLIYFSLSYQADRTNYYHPLGFAYFADGAHDDKDELEPSIVPPGSNSSCGQNEACPAPKYYRNGDYLGDWMHNDSNVTSTGDFGLDHYEPLFFHPFGDWLSYGTFEIHLTFDVTNFSSDFFYFCHVSILRLIFFSFQF